MSATTLDTPPSSFATSAELAALRAEVAELRRQVSELQTVTALPEWRSAMARLQAGYDSLSDEARAIHNEAVTEARALAHGSPSSDA
jgi:hypothetical protein